MTPATLAASRTTGKPSTSSTVTLTIARQALRTALGRLSLAVGSGAKALPVTHHVKVDVAPGALTLTATDFEAFVHVTVPCDANGTALALLPAKRLAEIVANLPPVGAVLLSITGQRAVLTAGRARFEIGGMHPDEFPLTPTVDAAERVTVNATAFLEALERVVAHASTADARQYLNVVRLAASTDGPTHGLRLAAFEGHHIAWLTVDASGGQWVAPCSLHRTSVPALARLFSARTDETTLTLGADDGRLVVESSDARATVRLVDLGFPDYAPAIAELVPTRTVVCDRLLLAAAIRRVALVTDEARRVTITLGDELVVSAADAALGAGDDVVAIEEQRGETGDEASREARAFAINASAALTSLDTFTDAHITLAYSGASKPILLRPADAAPVTDANTDPALVLIQPLRVL